jgi:hypothetical protein
MDNRSSHILVAIMIAVAGFEHLWLLHYGAAAYIDQRHHPSCMPFGYLIAPVFGIALTTSVVSAWLLLFYSELTGAALSERLLCAAEAAVIAPWTAVLLSLPGWLLGPVGCFAAPLIGAAAPYALIGLSFRSSGHPQR